MSTQEDHFLQRFQKSVLSLKCFLPCIFFLKCHLFSGLNEGPKDQVSPLIQQFMIPSPHGQVMEKHQNIYNCRSCSLFGEARGPLHEIQKNKGCASLYILQCCKYTLRCPEQNICSPTTFLDTRPPSSQISPAVKTTLIVLQKFTGSVVLFFHNYKRAKMFQQNIIK